MIQQPNRRCVPWKKVLAGGAILSTSWTKHDVCWYLNPVYSRVLMMMHRFRKYTQHSASCLVSCQYIWLFRSLDEYPVSKRNSIHIKLFSHPALPGYYFILMKPIVVPYIYNIDSMYLMKFSYFILTKTSLFVRGGMLRYKWPHRKTSSSRRWTYFPVEATGLSWSSRLIRKAPVVAKPVYLCASIPVIPLTMCRKCSYDTTKIVGYPHLIIICLLWQKNVRKAACVLFCRFWNNKTYNLFIH